MDVTVTREVTQVETQWTSSHFRCILVVMQALKLQITVDAAVVRLIPGLSVLLGQQVELIALGEEAKPARKFPVPGALAGKIALKDDFDAPLPDDMRRAFEGDGP